MIDCKAQVSIENEGTIFDALAVPVEVIRDGNFIRVVINVDMGVLGQSVTVDVPADVVRQALAS